MAAKQTTRVESGIPGWDDSQGAKSRAFRKWTGEFKAEIKEVTESPGKRPGTTNVRILTTLLDGPEQSDGTSPEGQEVSWFINVDPELVNDNGDHFSVDAYKQVYIAAGVKTPNGPEPKKLAGKEVAIQGWESKPDEKGNTYQRFVFVALKDSKTFAGDAE